MVLFPSVYQAPPRPPTFVLHRPSLVFPLRFTPNSSHLFHPPHHASCTSTVQISRYPLPQEDGRKQVNLPQLYYSANTLSILVRLWSAGQPQPTPFLPFPLASPCLVALALTSSSCYPAVNPSIRRSAADASTPVLIQHVLNLACNIPPSYPFF